MVTVQATKLVGIGIDTGSEQVNKNWGFGLSSAGAPAGNNASGTGQTTTSDILPN